jgi:hypothetical protein
VKHDIKRALRGVEGRVKTIFEKLDEIPDSPLKINQKPNIIRSKIIKVSIISVLPIADFTHLTLIYSRQAL